MQLIYGDCLDILPTLPAKSVDAIIADMPYGTTKCAWDQVIDLPSLWPALARLTDGPIILFAQSPFDKVLGASNLPMLKYEWIWEKTAATGHLNAKKMPMKAHENILVFYDKLPKYFPQKTQGHERKASVKRYDDTEVYGRQTSKPLSYDSTERYPRSVLKFPSDKQRSALHPTQKPVALCEYLIKTYSEEGDMVLDFCMGSGTTGVAARNLARNFIGIEKDPSYYRVACDRIYDL